jgi:L-threonylcarbamoyladenylate synthase
MKYSQQIIKSLKDGGVGVIPTDTVYGIVCSALNEKSVEKVYEIRRRRPDKPCIILIADISDLSLFGIEIDSPSNQVTNQLINQLWPGQVSIILPCDKGEFSYLHRGTNTLAFRLPANEDLRAMLRETGPLIAPSANPEGQATAITIEKAREYFPENVDFFEDAGPRVGEPSTVVSIDNGEIRILRQGSVIISPELL